MTQTIGSESPTLNGPVVVRSHDIIGLFSSLRLDDQTPNAESRPLISSPYRYFQLYLSVQSFGTPVNLQIMVQYRNSTDGKWYQYNQAPFDMLIYDAISTANPNLVCYTGFAGGREFSVRVIATGVSAVDAFIVSAAVEFFT